MKSVAIFCLLLLCCEEQALRERTNRPSEDGANAPDVELETTVSVAAGSAATIEISNTTMTIPAGATKADAEVRLRTLKSKPANAEVASLGDAKGDIVEITMYDKATGEIFDSGLLREPYELSQSLRDIDNIDNLNYIILTAQGTAEEKVRVLGNEGIQTSASLALLNTVVVSFSLGLTSAVVIPVELAELPSGIEIIIDSKNISNAGGGVLATSIPDAPSGAQAIAGSSESVSLGWTDNAIDEAAFKIERSLDNESFSLLVTTAADSTSYSDVTVSASMTYYYRLRACNSEGCSDYAETGAVDSLASPSIPDAPSELNAVASSAYKIDLSWSDNSNSETSVVIERSIDGTNFGPLATKDADSISHSDTSLSASTTYYYKVKSCSAAGCSEYTGVKSATTSVPTTHRVFVTSSSTSGNLGLLSGADGICQTEANVSSLGGTWKAILSDSTANAKDRLTISGEIFNMNSEKVAADGAALWNAATNSLLATFDYTATGAVAGGQFVWTGSLSDGTVMNGYHCNNWTGGMFSGGEGRSGVLDERWIGDGNGAPYTCDYTMRLLCIDGQ